MDHTFLSANNGVLIKKLFNFNASNVTFDETRDGVETHFLVE